MEQQHEEHEVYGGDIPDEAEMDADYGVEDEGDGEGEGPDGSNHPNKVPLICVPSLFLCVLITLLSIL